MRDDIRERIRLNSFAYADVTVSKPDTFLTDERRAVLNGEYDGTENVERTHKSRIKARSQSALSELIEVAESEEIDNAEVFDPKQIRTLLTTILYKGGLIEPEYQHVSDAYRNAMYFELSQFLKGWDR